MLTIESDRLYLDSVMSKPSTDGSKVVLLSLRLPLREDHTKQLEIEGDYVQGDLKVYAEKLQKWTATCESLSEAADRAWDKVLAQWAIERDAAEELGHKAPKRPKRVKADLPLRPKIPVTRRTCSSLKKHVMQGDMFLLHPEDSEDEVEQIPFHDEVIKGTPRLVSSDKTIDLLWKVETVASDDTVQKLSVMAGEVWFSGSLEPKPEDI